MGEEEIDRLSIEELRHMVRGCGWELRAWLNERAEGDPQFSWTPTDVRALLAEAE